MTDLFRRYIRWRKKKYEDGRKQMEANRIPVITDSWPFWKKLLLGFAIVSVTVVIMVVSSKKGLSTWEFFGVVLPFWIIVLLWDYGILTRNADSDKVVRVSSIIIGWFGYFFVNTSFSMIVSNCGVIMIVIGVFGVYNSKRISKWLRRK